MLDKFIFNIKKYTEKKFFKSSDNLIQLKKYNSISRKKILGIRFGLIKNNY
jgi:hypothetical protein